VDKLSIRLAACLVLALAMAGSALCAEKEKGKEQDEKVALDQVPAAVKDAAVKAVDGLILTEAEKEVKNGGAVVYELKGTASGKEYEVKVSADGKVLKAKEEKNEKEEKAGKKNEKDDDDGEDEKDEKNEKDDGDKDEDKK
jgi:hypothetical protein